MMDNGIVCIARHIQHLYVAALSTEALCQFWTAHTWHYHVSKQKMNWPIVGLTHVKRFWSIGCFKHPVSLCLQDIEYEPANSRLVIH